MRIEAYNYISKRDITNISELNVYRDRAKEQVHALSLERKRLYRDDDATAEQLQDLNKEIKVVRKEVRLCDTIEAYSRELEGHRRYLLELEKKRQAERMAHDHNRQARRNRESER